MPVLRGQRREMDEQGSDQEVRKTL